MADYEDAIVELLQEKGSLRIKKVLKLILKDDENNNNKVQAFNTTIDNLLAKQIILQNDKDITLNKAKISSIKRKRDGDDVSEDLDPAEQERLKKYKALYVDLYKNGERYYKENLFDSYYLENNPEKITRLFLGNLNRKVTEDDLIARFPSIKYIKWITDKETGEFYGSSFVEVRSPEEAAQIISADKTKFMGRPLKIYYCPPRPGDVWPPVESQNGSRSNLPSRVRQTEKPEGCRKLFAGNLSYDIDDETMIDFFKDCGKLVGLRWLTHKDSGEFKGCGYVEFATEAEADKAIKLNNKELLGRKIRLDWTN